MTGLAGLGFPTIADRYRNQGPLAGLHAGMLAARRPLVLFLACDIPATTQNVFRGLLAAVEDFDAVVPRTPDGRVHTLCALYRQSCLPVVKRQLESGRNRMREMLANEQLKVRLLDAVTGGFEASDLVNLNTVEDLNNFRKAHVRSELPPKVTR